VDLKRLGRRREGKPLPRNSGVRGRVCKAESELAQLVVRVEKNAYPSIPYSVV
jgi:hypothetical protein